MSIGEHRDHSMGGLDPGHVALMKDLADAASEQTAKRMFLAVGIDLSNPIEAQDTFAALRKIAKKLDDPEAIADIAWTRRMRPRTEGMFGKALVTAAGLAVIGGAHAIWLGLATALGVPIPHK